MARRLYRSRKERMVAGVCGGLAEYFDIDPTIVRLVAVLLALAGGPGLVIYIVMAIIVPEEPVGEYKAQEPPTAPPAEEEVAPEEPPAEE